MDNNDHDSEDKMKELREIAETKTAESDSSRREAADDSWMFGSGGEGSENPNKEGEEGEIIRANLESDSSAEIGTPSEEHGAGEVAEAKTEAAEPFDDQSDFETGETTEENEATESVNGDSFEATGGGGDCNDGNDGNDGGEDDSEKETKDESDAAEEERAGTLADGSGRDAREQAAREGMAEFEMKREQFEAAAQLAETITEHARSRTEAQEAGTLVEAPAKPSPAENVDLATSVAIGAAMAGELAYRAGKKMVDAAAELANKAKEELKRRFDGRD